MTTRNPRFGFLSVASWALLCLALLLYAWANVWNAWHGINSNDFKHIYLGMKALLDGNSPYTLQALHHQAALQGYHQIALNPYVYLPFTGHAMAFLAPFSLDQAVAIWFVLNHLFVAGSLWLISSLWPGHRVLALALLTLAMAFCFPLYRTLTAGQLNCALLLLICGGWKAMRTGRHTLAGGLMAFAALYKLMPGIYGLLFLIRRQWTAFFAMLAVGLSLFAVSTYAAGFAVTRDFFPVLRQMGYGKSTWPEIFSFWDDPSNQSINSFLTHILADNDHTSPWFSLGQNYANAATWVCTGLLLAAYLVIIIKNGKKADDEWFLAYDDVAWSATLLLGLLIPSLLWDHYLVMLILPVALMVKYAKALRHLWAGPLAMLCWIIICMPWQFDHPSWSRNTGVFQMSLKLWPALVLFGLSLCFIIWTGSYRKARFTRQSHSSTVDPTTRETSPKI